MIAGRVCLLVRSLCFRQPPRNRVQPLMYRSTFSALSLGRHDNIRYLHRGQMSQTVENDREALRRISLARVLVASEGAEQDRPKPTRVRQPTILDLNLTTASLTAANRASRYCLGYPVRNVSKAEG